MTRDATSRVPASGGVEKGRFPQLDDRDGRWLVAGGQAEYRYWRVGSWEAGEATGEAGVLRGVPGRGRWFLPLRWRTFSSGCGAGRGRPAASERSPPQLARRGSFRRRITGSSLRDG